jgi:hypothetical protein
MRLKWWGVGIKFVRWIGVSRDIIISSDMSKRSWLFGVWEIKPSQVSGVAEESGLGRT